MLTNGLVFPLVCVVGWQAGSPEGTPTNCQMVSILHPKYHWVCVMNLAALKHLAVADEVEGRTHLLGPFAWWNISCSRKFQLEEN